MQSVSDKGGKLLEASKSKSVPSGHGGGKSNMNVCQ